MASILTSAGKATKQKGAFGSTMNTPIYLQFVPGQVVDVITHPTAFNAYGNFQNTNSIIAIPHIQEGTRKTKSNLNNDDRYYPLMRGFVDVPTKGDPVLLCTIGGIKYYLGPLNNNKDNLFSLEKTTIGNLKNREENRVLSQGESLNFKKMELRRLAKIPNEDLDNGTSFNETYGDLMLEGRHGSSIRIGSRDINPYLIISNGRPSKAVRESLGDGGLISITNKGTLAQHFGNYTKEISVERNDIDLEVNVETEQIFGFTLASDLSSQQQEAPARFMGDLISSVNGGQNVQQEVYDYDKDQILINSDRLIFNSRVNDILISSNRNVHIGSRDFITISTKELIFEAEKVNIGDPYKKEMDKMVLGSALQEALNGIIDLIKEIQVNTQLGPQSPLPLPSEADVKTLIKNIVSNKHFIEK